jgi:hypothetical protein
MNMGQGGHNDSSMGGVRKKDGHVKRAQVVSVTVMIMAMKSVSVKTVKEICSARE